VKTLSDCRVLIVDDAKSNVDLLVEGLKDNYKLSVALNGEMALKAAAHNPPDLVLLDIVMPGIGGYDVCRRLREKPETAEVPIMFLSSLEEVENKAKGFEAGANDYVTKPFDMVEVRARVRSLIKAKAYNDAAKEQIAGELRVARDIQRGILPRDFSKVEKAYGVDLGAVLHPAKEVGGDLYGVCAAGADRLVIFLGDVSGKGIAASLFMVRAVTLAGLLAHEIPEPESILARLNNELAADNPSGMFVTFVCGVFTPSTCKLSLANAGQCRPVLSRSGEPPKWIFEKLGTALGLEPDLVFERTDIHLHKGDVVVFYSDGVSEAFNGEQQCYGNDHLLSDINNTENQTAPSIANLLLEKVRAFAGDAPQSDDIAIVVFKADCKSAAGPHGGQI